MKGRLRVLSTITIITSLCIIGAAGVVSGENQNQICNGDPEGNSTIDRNGCLDSDGDGYSDYSENWTKLDGADAFPFDEYAWSDMDNDGFTDQRGTDYSDDCPFTWGKSRVILRGCSDIDRDFVPDSYDDDADGDGIRNEMERAASTGTQLFDPYDPDSTPSDIDLDTILMFWMTTMTMTIGQMMLNLTEVLTHLTKNPTLSTCTSDLEQVCFTWEGCSSQPTMNRQGSKFHYRS